MGTDIDDILAQFERQLQDVCASYAAQLQEQRAEYDRQFNRLLAAARRAADEKNKLVADLAEAKDENVSLRIALCGILSAERTEDALAQAAALMERLE